jgi:hypothetical protein
LNPIPIMVNIALMMRNIHENSENMPPHRRINRDVPDFSAFSCTASCSTIS